MRQMNVTLRNEYFVSVLREETTQIFTNVQIFDKTTHVLPSGSIKSSSKDLNSDGIKEEFDIDIQVGNNADKIQQLLIMLFLDVEITDLNFNMRSVLFFEQSADLGVSSLFIYGTAKLYQNKPIVSSNFPRYEYDYDIFEKNNYNILDCFKDYYTRDYLLVPNYQQQMIPGNGFSQTKIKIHLKMDQEEVIMTKPTFFGTLKFAWLQYFSIFIPLYIFGQNLLRFILRFRFVHSQKANNLPLVLKEY